MGAPIAHLGEHQTLDHKVAGSILTWDQNQNQNSLLVTRQIDNPSPGMRCCVLEKDTSSPLLSTGSTQEAVPK